MPSPYNRVTDPIWTGGMTSSHFDQFNYDYGMFGGLDYDLPPLLQPLLDSLPSYHGDQCLNP